MTGALPYLWLTTRRDLVLRWLRGWKRPTKALANLVTIGLVGLFVWSLSMSRDHGIGHDDAKPFLVAYLAAMLALGPLSGFAERGIAFKPAEVDFLFPGPFRPRAIVLYYVVGQYSIAWFGALFAWFLFGRWAPQPWAVLVAALFCQWTATNLRLSTAFLALRVEESLWRRLRTPVRTVALLLGVALVVLIASALGKLGGLRGAIVASVSSPAARIALFPAVAVGDVATASGGAELAGLLLASAGCVVGSIALLLVLQTSFLEQSIGTSERVAKWRESARRGRFGSIGDGKRVSAVRLPGSGLFRGAGAVAWKNSILVRRSGRRLFFSIALTSFIFIPIFVAGERGGDVGLIAPALLAWFSSTQLRYDFRSESEQMDLLKSMPFSPTALAAAQVALPTFVSWTFQVIVLGVLVVFGYADPLHALLAAPGYLPLTAAIFAIANLAHFLGARSRGAAQFIQLAAFLVDLGVLLGIGGLLHLLRVPGPAILAALAVAQCAIVYLLLLLVGASFAAHDVSIDRSGA